MSDPVPDERRSRRSPSLSESLARRLSAVARALFAIIAVSGISGVTYVAWRTGVDGLLSHGLTWPLVALSLTALAGLALRPERLLELLLVLASVGVAVYLVEIFLAVASEPGNTRPAQAHARDPAFDTRSKYEVLVARRAEGTDAWPSLSPATWLANNGVETADGRLFPLGGISGVETILCNESGRYTVHHHDEHGFNNPPGGHAGDSPDLALVGDSFAQGWCVGPGEDLGAQLRSMGATVLNLGQNGTGPLLQLATLAEFALPVRPRVVLWFYYEENDLAVELPRERTARMLERYLQRGKLQGLRERQGVVDDVLRGYIQARLEAVQAGDEPPASETPRGHPLVRAATLVDVRTRLGLSPLFPAYLDAKQPLGLYRRILQRAREAARAQGTRLYLVYLPMWQRYALGHAPPVAKAVTRIASDLELPVIDFREVLDSHPRPLTFFPFERYGHYTAAGYEALAHLVHARLLRDGLL